MSYPVILNGDHAEFEAEWAGKDPKERPDWPLPSFDARDWAEAFCKIADAHGFKDAEGRPVDDGWMIGWFANALMRGLDEGRVRAAPSAAGGGEIPEGWALVPEEATGAMWQAGRDADEHPTDSYSAVWAAMVAAAPSPSQGSDMGEAGRETFETIAQWCEETFGPITPERIASRAAEEMIELRADPTRVEEAADVVIVLSRYPGLWDAVQRKMAVNRARKWRLIGDGTGYHVKAEGQAPEPPTAPQGADLAGLLDFGPDLGARTAEPSIRMLARHYYRPHFEGSEVDRLTEAYCSAIQARITAFVTATSAPPASAGGRAPGLPTDITEALDSFALAVNAMGETGDSRGMPDPDREEIVGQRRAALIAAIRGHIALAHPGSVAPTSGEWGGWLPMDDCPSDGKPVWVLGGRHDVPTRRQADGGYWRHAAKAGDLVPTLWHPEIVPAPPQASQTEGERP